MKTFIAKPVVVPSDLAERYDKRAGEQAGFLRNLLADKGALRQIDEEVLAIGLMPQVKGLMEDKDLPDDCKPMSIDRLSNVIYVMMIAYCMGTMSVDDYGDVTFGEGLEDAKSALELALSDKIKFANGKTMPTQEFMGKLKAITAPSSLDGIYPHITERKGIKKTISPKKAHSVAMVSIKAAQKLMAM